jgi:hypothetical protein
VVGTVAACAEVVGEPGRGGEFIQLFAQSRPSGQTGQGAAQPFERLAAGGGGGELRFDLGQFRKQAVARLACLVPMACRQRGIAHPALEFGQLAEMGVDLRFVRARCKEIGGFAVERAEYGLDARAAQCAAEQRLGLAAMLDEQALAAADQGLVIEAEQSLEQRGIDAVQDVVQGFVRERPAVAVEQGVATSLAPVAQPLASLGVAQTTAHAQF